MASLPWPATPNRALEADEVEDLLALFRGFGVLDPVSLRPRRAVLEALCVLRGDVDDDGLVDAIDVAQLLHLLAPYDEDARALASRSAGMPRPSLVAAWRAFPGEVAEGNFPGHHAERSWLASAHARVARGRTQAAATGEDACVHDLLARLGALLVGELQALAGGESSGDGESSDDGESSSERRWLTRYSPLLLWGEFRAVEDLLGEVVPPGWDAQAAVLGALEMGAGAPIDPRQGEVLDALREVEPLDISRARTWVLEAARALDERRGGGAPRLLDEEILENEGAIWSWLDVLALAALDDAEERVEALLSGGEDWLDFDALGEGELPLPLYRALRLRGVPHASLVETLGGHLGEEGDDWLEERAEEGWRWLAAYPEPLDLAMTRPTTERGLLHEGIDEAFGDVFSPRDPFSVRENPEDR